MKLNKDDQIKDRKTKRVRRDMVLHPRPRRRIKTLKLSATLSSPRARSPQTVSVPAQSPRLLRRKTTTGQRLTNQQATMRAHRRVESSLNCQKKLLRSDFEGITDEGRRFIVRLQNSNVHI